MSIFAFEVCYVRFSDRKGLARRKTCTTRGTVITFSPSSLRLARCGDITLPHWKVCIGRACLKTSVLPGSMVLWCSLCYCGTNSRVTQGEVVDAKDSWKRSAGIHALFAGQHHRDKAEDTMKLITCQGVPQIQTYAMSLNSHSMINIRTAAPSGLALRHQWNAPPL